MKVNSGTQLQSVSAVEQVFEYHQKTKHKPDKYAQGPEFLDWELQPSPYRYFDGIEKLSLPLDLLSIDATYRSLYQQREKSSGSLTTSLPITYNSLGILLGLSIGLSAHKEYMGDRWSLRCNPSSGNLHPTEAYIISQQIAGLRDGVYHYLSEDHSLQQRMVPANQQSNDASPLLLIALGSISWREAWKYGERAFRYCQLDIGHALAAINYAAACLGWEVKILNQWSSDNIAKVCGFNRPEDYGKAETENADLILSIKQHHQADQNVSPESILKWSENANWRGSANILDKHPIYHWPVIHQIELATEIKPSDQNKRVKVVKPLSLNNQSDVLAKQLIYRRRSAQHFDKQTKIEKSDFYTLLDKCLYRADTIPWNALSEVFPMAIIFYVHRVNSLPPGLYALVNITEHKNELVDSLQQNFLWESPPDCPAHLPFYLLSEGNIEKLSRGLSCHQGIASDGVFSVSMLFKFEGVINKQSMNYRKLYWQAGVLGQLLYLEAESFELQGTGIGCFFDDSIHSLLGITSGEYQVLYNFTMGGAFNDQRISTLPAYSHIQLNL